MNNIKNKLIQTFNRHKKIYISIIIILFISIIFFIKFARNNYKTINIGNNNFNKTLDEVEDYIFNISSYKATMEVTITSNKNINKYKMIQTHKQNNEETEDMQEILEPQNINGVKITYKNNILEIRNTQLSLNQIYSNYPYIESNNLWLNSFIKEYKEADKTLKEVSEKNEEIVLTLKIKNDKKIGYKEIYLDKKTYEPTKLLIKDTNQNNIIYILYTEIELNY